MFTWNSGPLVEPKRRAYTPIPLPSWLTQSGRQAGEQSWPPRVVQAAVWTPAGVDACVAKSVMERGASGTLNSAPTGAPFASYSRACTPSQMQKIVVGGMPSAEQPLRVQVTMNAPSARAAISRLLRRT